MPYPRFLRALGVCALFAAAGTLPARAQQIKTVFVIAMENHNWTQPANQFTGGIQQIYQNPNAPFVNSLVNGTATAVINGSIVNISEQTGDAANIKQGDDFLSQVVPLIMASEASKNHGVIILWWDESERDGVAGDNPDDLNHTIGEIIISDRAHENVNGLPYASPVAFTHSSDVRTIQNIFRTAGPYLADAANANDLSDLFKPGSVPKKS